MPAQLRNYNSPVQSISTVMQSNFDIKIGNGHHAAKDQCACKPMRVQANACARVRFYRNEETMHLPRTREFAVKIAELVVQKALVVTG